MIEKKLFSTTAKRERAILVAVVSQKSSIEVVKEHLNELAFLAQTAGVDEIARFTQNLAKPDSKTYVGKGKLEEILTVATIQEADMVIFDDDLTPSQVRNLEREFNIKILDRSLLILNIFSMRAQTSQAKTQVELAQYQYMYPRLTRLWTHLSKQKGGVGMRGPGEKELETDRRIVQDRIAFLKDKLRDIDKQSLTRRQGRDRMVRVAIVGYTNVGKSTLLNLLTKSDVLAENKLFATVDSTVRKVVYEDIPFLLTDTVGFIRKLPTHLIESFKSTLDEVREADILLHVVDISHVAYQEQIDTVNSILADIKAGDKPTIYVFNKMDAFHVEETTNLELDFEEVTLPVTLDDLKKSYLTKQDKQAVFISAKDKENIEELRAKLLIEVRKKHIQIFPNYLKTQVYYGNDVIE